MDIITCPTGQCVFLPSQGNPADDAREIELALYQIGYERWFGEDGPSAAELLERDRREWHGEYVTIIGLSTVSLPGGKMNVDCALARVDGGTRVAWQIRGAGSDGSLAFSSLSQMEAVIDMIARLAGTDPAALAWTHHPLSARPVTDVPIV